MKIATWNINSVKARMHALTQWLETAKPDVLCLQEIKTQDEGFPRMEVEALGYHCLVHGQKSYNGVAILSKAEPLETQVGLAGDDADEQARYAEVVLPTKRLGGQGRIRVATIYLPNGNPVEGGDSEKYRYKLAWMDRLRERALSLLPDEHPLVLAGDYNVIPRPVDCHDPKAWWGDALFRTETLERFRALKHIGLSDAFEVLDGRPEQYSFWDYQRGAWQNNNGIRIDHLLCNAAAMDAIESVEIDRFVRDGVKPSDHVPVVGQFAL